MKFGVDFFSSTSCTEVSHGSLSNRNMRDFHKSDENVEVVGTPPPTDVVSCLRWGSKIHAVFGPETKIHGYTPAGSRTLGQLRLRAPPVKKNAPLPRADIILSDERGISTVRRKRKPTRLWCSRKTNLVGGSAMRRLVPRMFRRTTSPTWRTWSTVLTCRKFTSHHRREETQQPHDSPGTLVFQCRRSRQNSSGVTPTETPNAGRVKGKRSDSYTAQLTRRTRTARFTISEVAVDWQ